MDKFARLFTGKTIKHIRTMDRTSTEPHVDIVFRSKPDRLFRMYSVIGWQIVSVMINTVRFRPKITSVRVHHERNLCRLELVAEGGYVVASFIARCLPSGNPRGEAFIIDELEREEGPL